MKTMKQIRENLSDFIQHLGWAFLGQECDCGHNKFNWLARYFHQPLFERYGDDDDMTPLNWQTAVTYWLGYHLGELSIWIIKNDLEFGAAEHELETSK